MKNLLIAALLAACQAVTAQSIDQIVDQKIKTSEAKQRAYADSLFKVKGDGGGTQNPPNDLPPCERGPKPESVIDVTTTSAVVVWDGEKVFGWDYSIYKGIDRVAFGSVKPVSNREPITYAGLAPGEYTISLQGNTCKSEAKSISFTVPKPTGDNGGSPGEPNGPPPVAGKFTYQLIMGTTGGGFRPEAPYGIDPQWVDRIEAFKYPWGYGISGICLWVGWNGYEKTPGVYEEAGFKKVIKFCRDRGLSLSVAFMGKRDEWDGVIKTSEIVTGSNGTKYIEGVPGFGAVYANYGNDRVNALMKGAIQSIAKLMKTYDKSFYMAMAGGGAGELVNHVFQNNGRWEVADFAPENLSRFNEWATRRGIASAGPPPMIQGPGIDWPHPDYNNPRGLEFGRFTTYGIYKYYKSFVDAVKSVSDIPCIYFYSVTSNRQFRAIQNPNLNFIASPGDGMYGSDGDGLDDLKAKVKVNSLNLGTFPNGISIGEVDPDDISPARMLYGRMPTYCEGNLNYEAFLQLMRDLYSRGMMAPHFAMSFCEQEIKGFEPYLKQLHQEYIGKPYVRPSVNSSNTITVNVTEKYRKSEDLMEGIDPYKLYTKYTDEGFWGGVSPDGSGPAPQPSKDYSPVKAYLEGNIGNYNGNVIFDLQAPTGELYSFTKGGYNKDSRLKVMSHSKFTTGVIISYLIDQGKLSLDTKVGDVIRSWDRPGRADITVRQIMGHLSGIPDNTDNEGAETLEYYVNDLVNKPGFTTPGERFIYSTSAYQVVARMAELVTGKPWKDLFKEILVDPCEMGSATYNPGDGPIPGKPLNPLAGYGLICSEREWMNFISMIRDGGVFKGRRVLNANVLEILKTQTSPGWSGWGVGVMIEDGKYVSEASSGCGTTILEGKYAWAIFTDSSYDKTYWQNIEVRKMVDQIYRQ